MTRHWVPDDDPENERKGLLSLKKIKEIGMLGSAWTAFAHTLHALLFGLGQQEMLRDKEIFNKLIECEPPQLASWLSDLLAFSYVFERQDAAPEPDECGAIDF